MSNQGAHKYRSSSDIAYSYDESAQQKGYQVMRKGKTAREKAKKARRDEQHADRY